jgi:transposase InsO family protein
MKDSCLLAVRPRRNKKGTYGARRIAEEIEAQGSSCGRFKAGTLMKLAVILDLFSRQVVGWSLNNRITKKLVMDALRLATCRRRPVAGLIFHSDRGSQYYSNDFQEMLKSHKMHSSMSRKGNCWDNAVAEIFFGSLKTERVFPSSYKTRETERTSGPLLLLIPVQHLVFLPIFPVLERFRIRVWFAGCVFFLSAPVLHRH